MKFRVLAVVLSSLFATQANAVKELIPAGTNLFQLDQVTKTLTPLKDSLISSKNEYHKPIRMGGMDYKVRKIIFDFSEGGLKIIDAGVVCAGKAMAPVYNLKTSNPAPIPTNTFSCLTEIYKQPVHVYIDALMYIFEDRGFESKGFAVFSNHDDPKNADPGFKSDSQGFSTRDIDLTHARFSVSPFGAPFGPDAEYVETFLVEIDLNDSNL